MVGAALQCSIRAENVFKHRPHACAGIRVTRQRAHIIDALQLRWMNSSWVGITRMQLAITPRMFAM
jgi:hypothetical protein